MGYVYKHKCECVAHIHRPTNFRVLSFTEGSVFDAFGDYSALGSLVADTGRL